MSTFYSNKSNKDGFKSSPSNPSEGRCNRPGCGERKLTGVLHSDLDIFKEIFFYPKNKDFIIRPIYIKALEADGFLIYMNGSACINTLTQDIISPLVENTLDSKSEDAITDIIKRIITAKNAEKKYEVSEITTDIVHGNVVLLIQDSLVAISFSTTEYEHRSIEKPSNENTIKGPKEAFVESVQVNRSLIRKHLKYQNLITESITVGEKAKADVYIMYIEGIADPDLIENVGGRIKSIKIDFLSNVSILEQYIEERSYSLVPTVLYTERPDRAAAFLNEGHIILIIDGSPACLIVPVTFWSFFHTAEDQYLRWFYGNFVSIIRIFAIITALLTPALYIAITNFHAEMVPSDLAVSIAAAREALPFPIIAEIIMMEASFELIREAGVRIPTTIGPTIGIVGALILGQAAVEANIISPILVIIVSITGLSSFAIPDISLSYTIRIARFLLIISGGIMGLLGVSLCLTVSLAYLLSITSFGVPFLSPLAPHYPSSKDFYTRPPVWKQWLRPSNISKLNPIRGRYRGRK